jgi:hypothetical protein
MRQISEIIAGVAIVLIVVVLGLGWYMNRSPDYDGIYVDNEPWDGEPFETCLVAPDGNHAEILSIDGDPTTLIRGETHQIGFDCVPVETGDQWDYFAWPECRESDTVGLWPVVCDYPEKYFEACKKEDPWEQCALRAYILMMRAKTDFLDNLTASAKDADTVDDDNAMVLWGASEYEDDYVYIDRMIVPEPERLELDLMWNDQLKVTVDGDTHGNVHRVVAYCESGDTVAMECGAARPEIDSYHLRGYFHTPIVDGRGYRSPYGIADDCNTGRTVHSFNADEVGRAWCEFTDGTTVSMECGP